MAAGKGLFGEFCKSIRRPSASAQRSSWPITSLWPDVDRPEIYAGYSDTASRYSRSGTLLRERSTSHQERCPGRRGRTTARARYARRRQTISASTSDALRPISSPRCGDAYQQPRTAPHRAAPGFLANDTDPNGDALTAALTGGPAHGTLS